MAVKTKNENLFSLLTVTVALIFLMPTLLWHFNLFNLYFQETEGQLSQSSPYQNVPSPAATDATPPDAGKPARQQTPHHFASVILADTTQVWHKLFGQYGMEYTPPAIIFYEQDVSSPCGEAETRDGPFYCVANKTLYLDSDFLSSLKYARRLPGDFAVAYGITHEIGHHVQNEWGILAELGRMPDPDNVKEFIEIPGKIETMADCLAGVWASRQDGQLTPRIIRNGITIASNIEALYPPEEEDGVVIALPRTHGETKDRIQWFTRGYKGGHMKDCNTFWE